MSNFHFLFLNVKFKFFQFETGCTEIFLTPFFICLMERNWDQKPIYSGKSEAVNHWGVLLSLFVILSDYPSLTSISAPQQLLLTEHSPLSLTTPLSCCPWLDLVLVSTRTSLLHFWRSLKNNYLKCTYLFRNSLWISVHIGGQIVTDYSHLFSIYNFMESLMK